MTTATQLRPDSFQFICDLIKKQAAIVVDPAKTYLVESRLGPIARQNGFDSIDTLADAIRAKAPSALIRQVVEAMTTNETSFFRDMHPFDALKQKIIPELLETNARERSLTIWSNACSSGQEIYSIAMMLREHFPELERWNVRLIATDLSNQILDKAQSGIFNQTEVNRGLPMTMLLKYFEKSGLTWRIQEQIKSRIEFRCLNLIEPFPSLPPVDIVMLRNVLIYFSPETKTEILKKVKKAMKPRGFLFLGGAETTMNLGVDLVRETMGPATFYRPQ